jgi:hypothetical protein
MCDERFAGRLMAFLTYARAFATTAASLEYSRGQINGYILLGETSNMNSAGGVGAGAKAALDLARGICADIPSLNAVCLPIDRILQKLECGILPLLLYNELELLQLRLLDELQEHFYWPVTRSSADLYINEAPFGSEVYDAFPSARLDIANAFRCIVFGQSTASVFHLMRVMEVGLKVLGREAGIPYAPSWEAYLSQLNVKLAVPYKSQSASWKKKAPLIRELCGDVFAVKTAWRNPTMHVVREYTSQEAWQITHSIDTFLRRLATKHREKGKPIAVGLLGYVAPA